jgi:adenine-specific DNA-methyltransferase
MAKQFKFFEALPPYYGGKRRLVKTILGLIPGKPHLLRLADGFAGGGSVSLMAKNMGFQVLTNDISERSYLIGQALIENNTTRINEHDINRLFMEFDGDYPKFIEENFSPKAILSKQAQFLDQAFAQLRATDEESPKRYLLTLLLVKYIFSMREFGKFSTPNCFNIPMEDRKIEYIKNSTYKSSIKAVLTPTLDALRVYAAQVNNGVMDNGQENKAYKMDIREFCKEAKADVLYLDPPYAGTQDYETNYHVLDQILAGQTFELKKSEFSRTDGNKFLGEVFEAARNIPTWILSAGNAGGALDDYADLIKMIEQFRKVRGYRVKYKHIPAVSGENHQAKNEEFIILGEMR